MKRILAIVVLAIGLSSCDEDTVTNDGGGIPSGCYDSGCTTSDLPLVGATDAPVITDVALECQAQSLVVLATATDPQGTPNLLNILQEVGVFPDVDCQGAPIIVQDDLAGSGLEESFGDAFLATANQALYDQICACNSWPVNVRFLDANGNINSGRVLARVTR
jgi:hypothetical protein